jgi:hypothetical protein
MTCLHCYPKGWGKIKNCTTLENFMRRPGDSKGDRDRTQYFLLYLWAFSARCNTPCSVVSTCTIASSIHSRVSKKHTEIPETAKWVTGKFYSGQRKTAKKKLAQSTHTNRKMDHKQQNNLRPPWTAGNVEANLSLHFRSRVLHVQVLLSFLSLL